MINLPLIIIYILKIMIILPLKKFYDYSKFFLSPT